MAATCIPYIHDWFISRHTDRAWWLRLYKECTYVAHATREVVCWVCCSLKWPAAEVCRASIGVWSHLIAMQVNRILSLTVVTSVNTGLASVGAQHKYGLNPCWLPHCFCLMACEVATPGVVPLYIPSLLPSKQDCFVMQTLLLAVDVLGRALLTCSALVPPCGPTLPAVLCAWCVCMVMCRRGVSGCMVKCEEWAAAVAAFGLFGAAMWLGLAVSFTH